MATGRGFSNGTTPQPYQPGVLVLGGRAPLEVVGESRFQDALWHIVGESPGGPDRIRKNVVAVLRPDPNNPHDEYAVEAIVTDHRVGYLSREDAASMQHAIIRMEHEHGRSIGLRGVIAGGGLRPNGPGQLGVFLSFDPSDFDLPPEAAPAPRAPTSRGSVRTGLSVAVATDQDDTSYNLSWMEGLPRDSARRVARVRELLGKVTDPIDRHFMFAQLEKDLYLCRDAFASALAEYDETCAQHDSEMELIRSALVDKLGKVPMLETYRQMCIRQHKAQDWEAGLRWAERGLALYGSEAANGEWVTDLATRAMKFREKLADG